MTKGLQWPNVNPTTFLKLAELHKVKPNAVELRKVQKSQRMSETHAVRNKAHITAQKGDFQFSTYTHQWVPMWTTRRLPWAGGRREVFMLQQEQQIFDMVLANNAITLGEILGVV